MGGFPSVEVNPDRRGFCLMVEASTRPAHGGYQDAFAAADLLPLAREIAAGVIEQSNQPDAAAFAAVTRQGGHDSTSEVQSAFAALRWRFYAQADFRAAVSK